MTIENVFGSEDRYYASQDERYGQYRSPEATNFEHNLQESLLKHYPELKKTVERAYRRWNLIVREILRTETALRLTVGENRQEVPVQVKDGFPLPFQKIFQQAPDKILWELALHQTILTSTQSGLQYVGENLPALVRLLRETKMPNLELAVVAELVDRLIEEGRAFNLLILK